MSNDKKPRKPRKPFVPEIIESDTIVTKVLADRDLEMVVLGAVLLEEGALNQIAGDFTENLFYHKEHQVIARSILDLYLRNDKIDILTVTIDLKGKELLDIVGGAYYISSLTNRVAGASNIEYWLRLLQQYSLGRYILEVGNIARYKVFNPGNDIFDVYEELQSNLDNALKDVIKYQVSSVSSVHEKTMANAYKILETGGIEGVSSGLWELDEYTNGWQSSDLIILAGRPGMGKTAKALSLFVYPTCVKNIPVAFFTLEMSKEQLIARAQSYLSGVNASRIVKKQCTKEELDQITLMAKDLSTAPMYIDDTPNISLVDLKTKCRKLVREKGVRMIIVDYLQLMRSGLNITNREQEIAEISRGLKALAKELAIPVIALSQLSRVVESRADKKPMLSDLRESGQIEQDADMVIFCYRPEYYGTDEYEIGGRTFSSPGLFVSIIAKHRNGGLGEIVLGFNHEQIKVVNYSSLNQIKNTTFVVSNKNPMAENGSQNTTNVLQINTNFVNEGPLNNTTNVEQNNELKEDDLPF